MTITARMAQAVQMLRYSGTLHCFVLNHDDMRELELYVSERPKLAGLDTHRRFATFHDVPFSANASSYLGASVAIATMSHSGEIELHAI